MIVISVNFLHLIIILLWKHDALIFYLPLKFRLFILKLRGANGLEETIFPPTREKTEIEPDNRAEKKKKNQPTYNLLDICRSIQASLTGAKGQEWHVDTGAFERHQPFPFLFQCKQKSTFRFMSEVTKILWRGA